jgi:hypothetical protein
MLHVVKNEQQKLWNWEQTVATSGASDEVLCNRLSSNGTVQSSTNG